jgi:hypothetical protein
MIIASSLNAEKMITFQFDFLLVIISRKLYIYIHGKNVVRQFYYFPRAHHSIIIIFPKHQDFKLAESRGKLMSVNYSGILFYGHYDQVPSTRVLKYSLSIEWLVIIELVIMKKSECLN